MQPVAQDLRFDGKTAVVTGGASGIGRDIAERMAARGATVVVLDRDEAGGAKVRDGIIAAGGAAHAIKLDLSQIETFKDVVDKVLAAVGRIDVLVNSAGLSQLRKWDEITPDDWDRIFSVNLKGLFFLSQQVARHMCERKAGRIVNIASVGGKRGSALTLHYGASKAGVLSVTRSLAMVLAPSGITVNAVCPGYVETGLTDATDRDAQALGWAPGQRAKELVGRIPLGRFPEVAEVSNAALFLASDQASYITGQSVNVCGGVVME